MKSRICFGAGLVLFSLLSWKFARPAQAQTSNDAEIKRGQYLVERVAMCADCHTPRLDNGNFNRHAWLQGNVLDFKPTHPMPFMAVAPRIAGLPTFPSDKLAVRFLETGTNATGKMAVPPMPPYRFNHQDATAVVAYLRSLKNESASN